MSDDELFKVASEGKQKTGNRSGTQNVPTTGSSNIRLAELRKQRGALKGRLTLFDKYISKLDMSKPLDSTFRVELNMRTQSAAEFYETFSTVQSEIEQIVDEKELDVQLEYRDQFEQQYYALMAAAKCMSSDGDERQLVRSVPSFAPVSVRLPEIKLPAFDGSFDQWLEFRNSYITMIHSREDLDPIQKFHYLRSSLSGAALQVISALEFTTPNYAHAWDLIENRFHNNRLLVQNHVKSLFSAQSLSKESPDQIRKIIDATLRNLRALKSLNEPTESWDTLIIYLIVSKLDQSTEREWENYKGSLLSDVRRGSGSFKLTELLTFLKNRADMLDMIKSSNSTNKNHSCTKSSESKQASDNKKHQISQQTYSYVTQPVNKGTSSNNNSKAKKHNRACACVLCGGSHALYSCANFLNMSVSERWKIVKDKNICHNCIRTSHALKECVFGPCKLCHDKHNTLLHSDSVNGDQLSTAAHPAQNNAALLSLSSSQAFTQSTDLPSVVGKTDDYRSVFTSNSLPVSQPVLQTVLLSTALVELADSQNKYQTVRALLDNGSQNCFVTENLCKRLNVPIIQSAIRISGVGQSVTQSTHTCNINMRSRTGEYQIDMQCLVLPSITARLPSINIDIESIHLPSHIRLADPTFNVSSDIDLLIGADIFWDLLKSNKMRLRSGPYLHESKLGWILAGPIYNKISNTGEVQCNFVQIDSQLRKFWEIEEISNPSKALSKEDLICETLFAESTKRDEHGRFSVQMPLKESPDELGESYTMAKNRFLSLERKLDRSPEYKELYCDFIREYEELGHMSLVSEDLASLEKPYYILPHHGVYRESSSTTKLRVVFDASAATAGSKSLNDIQYVGPPLQNEIFSILLRFRQYQFVACADIEKMYRQILIHPDQRNLQLILWRANKDMPIQLYRLNTVTYGTTSAPYLSLRCLKQLSQDCQDDVIARVIDEDFYVDDLITGHDDLNTLLDICDNTSKVLKSACLPLRKWIFNSVKSAATKNFSGREHYQSKTLGVGWCNTSDQLHFITKLTDSETVITKRLMLSVISQIYDPLGLLAPAVIKAKILLQKLWLSKIDWNNEVPVDVASEWHDFTASLRCLQEIYIPRWVLVGDSKCIQLHVFTDASQNAYGACAYIRCLGNDGSIVVRLLCAKTQVAPLQTISIPRLELCGALIGARLYSKIVKSLRLQFNKIYFWTDSTIVQGWLRMSPHLLKTFVQNRVSKINSHTGDNPWRHIKGAENPADLLSRGVDLNTLKYNEKSLWWSGPPFLSEPNSCWPCCNSDEFNNVQLPELKPSKTETVTMHSTQPSDWIDFNNFSSFSRLQRTVAFLLRFINNARATTDERKTGSLSVIELQTALKAVTRVAQQQIFSVEFNNLKNNLPVNVKKGKSINKISGLNIFIDCEDIIRIGGRLHNATKFNYDKKHPMLLSSKHRLAWLLFTSEHKRLLHAAPLLLVSSVRDKWWVLGARNLARRVVHNCVICARLKGQTVTPLMGNLPSERLEPGYPFARCAADYLGPLLFLNRKGRGAQLIKGYVCLFICFTTRAIHLELVGSLSTQDYLLAFKRFISRRGKPFHIFSDNGKNFVGAEKEIAAVFKNPKEILDFASENSIRVSFIPPYAPHFGGLWEAGVKSCKYHLRRVMGNARLTYEEFITVLTQIEAVLNSRPLSPLSTDPNDYRPLTPAHFLIGRPLTAPPCEDLSMAVTMRLGRYDRVEQLRQHFWERWAKEYVSEMQRRTKWKEDGEGIVPDQLVVIKDDNLPPLRWRMGRIIQVIPGRDHINRVADIRTATGTIRRAWSKICPLPVQHVNEEVGSVQTH